MKIKSFKVTFSLLVFSLFCMNSGCVSKILKYEKEKELKQIKEFENKVKIEIPAEVPQDSAKSGESENAQAHKQTFTSSLEKSKAGYQSPLPKGDSKVDGLAKKETQDKDSDKNKKADKRPKSKKEKLKELEQAKKDEKHWPELESSVGFIGRRPIKDPIRVGEKVVHKIEYLNMRAGTMTLETKPFAMVDGRKSYHFKMSIETTPFFSKIYQAQDEAIVLMDFDTLIPSVYQLHIKETAKLREARMLFDRKQSQAFFWEKKVTAEEGEQEKKQQWEIPDYSQSVFSTIFYLRFFQWDVGNENAFRMADDNQNLIWKAKTIRKQKIETEVGEINTVVIQPSLEFQGQPKPIGEIFLYLTDDDRKLIVKVESKIKIGTLSTEVIDLKLGE